MKLVVVSHSYMEAVPRQKWLALRNAAPEIELLIITPRRWRETDFWSVCGEPYEAEGLRVVPLPIVLNGYVSRHAYVSPALIRLLREFRPDAIQVEAEPWSLVYAEMMSLHYLVAPQAKMVFFTWWNTPRRIPLPFQVSHRMCLAATKLVLAGNHGALEVLRAHGYRGPVEVVPQVGVNVEMFRPMPRSPELMARYGLGDSFVVGYVGRLTRPKGVDTLVASFARLTDSRAKLLIVGDGPERNTLQSLAKSRGIQHRVVFAGTVGREEVPRHMNLMDALVLPSRREQWEQFGHVLIEAMACGVPVIGSDSGEIPRVIGDAGLVFPIGDFAMLCEHIRRLMLQPDFASECRAKGWKRVQEHYTHQAIAQRLREIYTTLCRN